MPDNSHSCDVWPARQCHRKISSSPRSRLIDSDQTRQNPLVQTKSGPKRHQVGRVSRKKAHKAQKEVDLFAVSFARYGLYSLIRDSHFRHGMPVQEISDEASVLCYSAAHSRRGTWST